MDQTNNIAREIRIVNLAKEGNGISKSTKPKMTTKANVYTKTITKPEMIFACCKWRLANDKRDSTSCIILPKIRLVMVFTYFRSEGSEEKYRTVTQLI